MWYGTIGLAVALVLMYVVSKLTRDDPKDSDDFYEALDSRPQTLYAHQGKDQVTAGRAKANDSIYAQRRIGRGAGR